MRRRLARELPRLASYHNLVVGEKNMDRFIPPEFEALREIIMKNRTPDDLIHASDTVVTAELFADRLGVTQQSSKCRPISEGFKLNCTTGLINVLGVKSSVKKQEEVISEFAAKYLPATVDKFLDPPSLAEYAEDVRRELLLHNAYYRVIFLVQHSRYFYKYLRSRKAIAVNNKRLPKVIAERLLALAPTWDQYFDHPPEDEPGLGYKHLAHDIICLLTGCLVAAAQDPDQEKVVPQEIRDGLTPWLQKWVDRYSDTDLGIFSGWLLRILIGDKEFIEGTVLRVRRDMKSWDVCSMHGCKKKQGLKACSRCFTVRYCCAAHQKEHWNYKWIDIDSERRLLGHREHCFKTDY